MKNKKLTETNINKAIISIAFPAIFSFMFVTLFQLIDTFWLDKLKYKEVFASMGSASFIMWSVYSVMKMVTSGINSVIAQYIGANKKKDYENASWEGIFISLFIGIIVTIIMNLIYPSIFIAMGLKGKILSDSCSYFKIMNTGFIILFLFQCTEFIFKAHGNTKLVMLIEIMMLSANAIIDPIFILGKFSIPKFGIEGAAIASVISQFIGLILSFSILIKKKYIPIFPNIDVFKLKNSIKIIKIGAPIALTSWIFSMVYPVLTSFITKLGNTSALGALSVCHKIESVAYFIAVGFSIAAATLSGQYIGANDIKNAEKVINRIIVFSSFALSFSSIIFIFFPEKIISLIVSSPDIIKEGSNYLRIIGYFEIFIGWEFVFEGAFTGIGKTFYPMFVSIPLTLSRIPLSYILAFNFKMGVIGIWWAISITTMLKGIIIASIFWSKTWYKHIDLSKI